MKIFPELRIAAMLRRIAKALEKGNELSELKLSQDYPELRKKLPRRPSKIVDFSSASVEEWNKAWREAHPSSLDDELREN